MTIRFFILQAHYRSTLDFSNEAMQAAEKGFKKLMNATADVVKLPAGEVSDVSDEITGLKESVIAALCDDLNTPVALANLFEAVRIVNQVKDRQREITCGEKKILEELLLTITTDVLGLVSETSGNAGDKVVGGLMELILKIRSEAKEKKDFATSDKIRDALSGLGIVVKDTKGGSEWNI